MGKAFLDHPVSTVDTQFCFISSFKFNSLRSTYFAHIFFLTDFSLLFVSLSPSRMEAPRETGLSCPSHYPLELKTGPGT